MAEMKAPERRIKLAKMDPKQVADEIGDFILRKVLEMKKTGSTDKVNIVAQAAVPVKHADGSVSTTTFRLALGAPGNSDATFSILSNAALR